MGERDRLGMENRDMQNDISKLASRWNFATIDLYIVLILRKRYAISDI